MKYLITALMAVCIVLAALPASAVWQKGGNIVADEYSHQSYPMAVSDGDGNIIVVWKDSRSGSSTDIYAQKLDRYGNPQWTPNGIAIAAASIYEMDPKIVSDGAGGAVILWQEYDSGTYSWVARRIDADGSFVWGSPSILLSQSSSVSVEEVLSDQSGGLIIAWYSDVSGNFDIYAQRVDVDGTVQWGTNGTALCSDAGNQQQPRLCSDGTGGAIVAWFDYRNGNWDVYARRIGSSGSVYWTTDGVAVCTATGSQVVRTLVSDGSLGAIIAWSDARSGTTDIYAQRITGSGFVQWAADGIPICTASGSQSNVVGGSDGNGGAILAWTDARAGQDDIYAQKVDFYGSTGWTYDGVPVCTQGSQQYSINLVVSPTGNTVLSWSDARLGTYNIFAQILDQTGTRMSVPDGVQLSPGTFGCEHNVICADDEGGAVTAWNTTSTYAVMAQRIERNGFWGYPAPMIADVRDVPGDQGGSVDLAWYASRLDPWPDMAIDRYTVWRAISHPDAMLLASSGARIIDSVEELASPDKETPSIMAVEDGAPPVRDGDVIRRETVGATTYFWKMLSTIDAYYLDSYSEVAETLFDSTGVSDEHHYFQVIAHSTVPSMFWISETDSGYSVDNLAPAIPLGIMGEQSYTPEGLSISWDPNLENDLSHYNIYRGLTGSFEPGPGNLLTSVPDTVTFDGTWSWDAGYYYKLAAVDIHGNESGYALLAPSGVTGDDVPDTPLATYLGQNYPNPFNPVTTIAFGLSRASHVSLKVYDSAGRLVRVVLDEDRAPGHYKVAWNGLNSRGAPVSSGIYYYRLVSQTFDETRKMVMLR